MILQLYNKRDFLMFCSIIQHANRGVNPQLGRIKNIDLRSVIPFQWLTVPF